jgi:hypothetical protein
VDPPHHNWKHGEITKELLVILLSQTLALICSSSISSQVLRNALMSLVLEKSNEFQIDLQNQFGPSKFCRPLYDPCENLVNLHIIEVINGQSLGVRRGVDDFACFLIVSLSRLLWLMLVQIIRLNYKDHKISGIV